MRQRERMTMRACFFSLIYSTSCAFFQFKPPVFRGITRYSEDSRVALASRDRDRRLEAPGYDANNDYDKSTDLYITYQTQDDTIYKSLMRDERYELDPMVVSKRVIPSDTGEGAMWPNYRQAHQVLRRRNDNEPGNSRVIVLSNGLADPCDPELDFTSDPKFSGFGYEVVGEFRPSVSAEEEGNDDYSSTFNPYRGWELLVTDRITQQIATSQMVYHDTLDKWEVMSGTINIPYSWNCPNHLVNKTSATMAFLLFWSCAPWLPTTTVVSGDVADTTVAKAFCFPEGSDRLLCFRLIAPLQLATIWEGSSNQDIKQARIDFVKGWETDGSHHITDISSPSRKKITSTSKSNNSNSEAARIDFFDSIGKSSPFIMAPMVGLRCDQHRWPGRPALRAITVEGKEGDNSK